MLEKHSLLVLLDSGDLSKVLNSLRELGVDDEKIKTVSYEYSLLEEKHKGKSITTRKYKTELKKLIKSLRESIEAIPAQDLGKNRTLVGWKKILVVIGWTVGIMAFLGSVAEMSGYSLRDLVSKESESKTDTLNKLDIKTTGDKSPAINAPNGEVKIEYQELELSKGAIDKNNKPKN
jgi:hypothetical protein